MMGKHPHKTAQTIFWLFIALMAMGTGCAQYDQTRKSQPALAQPTQTPPAPAVQAESPSATPKAMEPVPPTVVEKSMGSIVEPMDRGRPARKLETGSTPSDQRGESKRQPLALTGAEEKPKAAISARRSRELFAPASRRAGKTPGSIVFNFDDAELSEVIRAMADLLNINYIVDPAVRGKVTIHTAGGLTREELFPVFFQILEINGYTAIKEGDLYKIVKITDATRMPLAARIGHPAGDLPPGERFMIQVIPLDYISVQEITKLLTPFISAEGSMVSHADSNTLLVVDKFENIQKVMKLVDVFDIDLLGKVGHRFYRLTHISAAEGAKLIGEIMGAYGASAGTEPRIVPIERLNMLLVLSPNPVVFEKIQQFLRTLDVPGHDVEPRIYVYPVKNGQAKNLATLLNAVFTGKTLQAANVAGDASTEQVPETKSDTAQAPVKTPFGTIKAKAAEAAGAEPELGKESGTLTKEVRITPDEVRNALIIEAIPRDYRIIESILQRLDVLPRQVLIEVTIAEITLDNRNELGMEWSYLRGDGQRPDTHLLSASAGTEGLQYMIGQADRWTQVLKAKATESKVNILSSPTILASDNKEAKIDISTEIPVATSTVKYESEGSPITTNSIQYRNTGVILSVTPHINEFGLVSMDIDQEVSNQLENNVQVGSDSMPAFFKRTVRTTLTVKHGQTIVIGGLIRQTLNQGYSGLPCLGGLPLARYAAGKSTDSIEKTELIILITPRVIANLSDVDAVTGEFREKVSHVMKPPESVFPSWHRQ